MKGWVYVIKNKAMPSIIKVGFSMSDPEERAIGLNHTGTPHPYIVDYEILVEGPRDIERLVHERLQEQREGKEWFRCSTEEAIAAIKTVVGSQDIVENYKHADRARADDIRRKQQLEVYERHYAEEQQRERNAVLDQKRQAIISRYAAALPKLGFRQALIDGFTLHLVDNLFGTHLVDKKHARYIELLSKRNVELEAIGNETPTTLANRSIGATPAHMRSSPVDLVPSISQKAQLAEVNGSQENEQFQRSLAAAKAGYAAAQYEIGSAYERGHGIIQDSAQALKWYHKAACQGYLRAQYTLGAAYLLGGTGVQKNEALGLSWLRRAAEAGDSDAQFALGGIYLAGFSIEGLSIPQNKTEAVTWLRKAAENGCKDAQLTLDNILGGGDLSK